MVHWEGGELACIALNPAIYPWSCHSPCTSRQVAAARGKHPGKVHLREELFREAVTFPQMHPNPISIYNSNSQVSTSR
ncbi:hypothetical protein ACET3Z_031867 [Daucus carota]